MKKNILQTLFIILALFIISFGTNAQLNVGGATAPVPTAMLQVSGTLKGMLPPVLTTTQRDAIGSPANGLVIFNVTTGCYNFYCDGTGSVNTSAGWYSNCGTGIVSLTCGSYTTGGTLTAGVAASGVTITIPYTNGGGAAYSVSAASAGVTGLTAAGSGTLAAGSGNIVLNVTGTPATSGTASFSITVNGSTCSAITKAVALPPTVLTCGSAATSGTPIVGQTAANYGAVTITIPYTNGNSAAYSISSASTGVTGLTAAASGNLASGSGNLVLTVTGTPSASGTATFSITANGSTCSAVTLTVNDVFQASLTGSDLTTYNSAAAGTWLSVSLTGYLAAKAKMINAGFGGLDAANISTLTVTGATDNADATLINYSPQANAQSGVNWVDMPATGKYITMMFVGPNATATLHFKTGTGGGTANNVGPLTGSLPAGFNYLIYKGNIATTTDTKIGSYHSAALRNTANGSVYSNGFSYASGDVTTGFTNYASQTRFPHLQAVYTTTKQW